jgi:hypothetical protein
MRNMQMQLGDKNRIRKPNIRDRWRIQRVKKFLKEKDKKQ